MEEFQKTSQTKCVTIFRCRHCLPDSVCQISFKATKTLPGDNKSENLFPILTSGFQAFHHPTALNCLNRKAVIIRAAQKEKKNQVWASLNR